MHQLDGSLKSTITQTSPPAGLSTCIILVQSNLFYVTFQGNSVIGSHKTGGHLIQV